MTGAVVFTARVFLVFELGENDMGRWKEVVMRNQALERLIGLSLFRGEVDSDN